VRKEIVTGVRGDLRQWHINGKRKEKLGYIRLEARRGRVIKRYTTREAVEGEVYDERGIKERTKAGKMVLYPVRCVSGKGVVLNKGQLARSRARRV